MVKFLKVVGLLFLFLLLINVSIFLFNYFSPWVGIGLGAITIISYICLIIRVVQKFKFK